MLSMMECWAEVSHERKLMRILVALILDLMNVMVSRS